MHVLGHGRLTRKFQTTIPQRARKLLKLNAHDLVVFVDDGGQVIVKKAELSSFCPLSQ
jgi:bifunctional DNA-binding transcriptional regulator/antitoxin component of YhaV-PrlF toxin-antitoxin module